MVLTLGIVALAGFEAVIIWMMNRDRLSARTDFLAALRDERVAIQGVSATMAGLQAQIERQTGVLVALARVMLGSDDVSQFRKLPSSSGRASDGD